MRKLFFLLLCCIFSSIYSGKYEQAYTINAVSLFEQDIIAPDNEQNESDDQALVTILSAIPMRQQDVSFTCNMLPDGRISNVQLNEPYSKIAAQSCTIIGKSVQEQLNNELLWACTKPNKHYSERRIKIAKALACGADPKSIHITNKVFNPLYIALDNNDPQLAQFALDHGALFQNKDTPRPTISYAKTLATAQLLKDRGALAKHNSAFYHQHLFTITLPHYSADLITFFVENGFPVHTRNEYNYTPLMRLMSRAFMYKGQEDLLLQKATFLLAKYTPKQIQHTISDKNPAFRNLVHHADALPQRMLISHLTDKLIDTLSSCMSHDTLCKLPYKTDKSIAPRPNSRYTFVQ